MGQVTTLLALANVRARWPEGNPLGVSEQIAQTIMRAGSPSPRSRIVIVSTAICNCPYLALLERHVTRSEPIEVLRYRDGHSSRVCS
jgi:hypothetical protein